MQNLSVPLKQPIMLTIEGFMVPSGLGLLFFCLTMINYILVLLGNGVVVFVIVIDKQLHRPMFIMFLNLALCDLLGASAVLPRLMSHFLNGQQKVGYAAAIMQALGVHMYGASVQTTLAAMSYDRYLAVCSPLHYNTIMTSSRIHCTFALIWIVAVLCIAPLFLLHINVPLCRDLVRHVYCSNRSILQLACSPTPTNNIYGLAMTYTLSSSVFMIIAFSYIKILHTTISRYRVDGSIPKKTLQTCGTHLIVYIIYEIATFVIVVSFRLKFSENIRKFSSIIFIIIPPAINPVIYGLLSRELRNSIIKLMPFRCAG